MTAIKANRCSQVRCALITLLACTHAWAQDLFDPTRPPVIANTHVATEAAPAPLTLTAILQSGSRRIAVIDGRVVCEGDHFNDVTIDAIRKDDVQYTRAGRHEVVRLRQQLVEVRSRMPREIRK